MTDSAPTPALHKFLARYATDDNEWWRLECGHHQNLFEEAVEENERLRSALRTLEQWDMLTLTADGHGAATADAPWARALIAKALDPGAEQTAGEVTRDDS